MDAACGDLLEIGNAVHTISRCANTPCSAQAACDAVWDHKLAPQRCRSPRYRRLRTAEHGRATVHRGARWPQRCLFQNVNQKHAGSALVWNVTLGAKCVGRASGRVGTAEVKADGGHAPASRWLANDGTTGNERRHPFHRACLPANIRQSCLAEHAWLLNNNAKRYWEMRAH